MILLTAISIDHSLTLTTYPLVNFDHKDQTSLLSNQCSESSVHLSNQYEYLTDSINSKLSLPIAYSIPLAI